MPFQPAVAGASAARFTNPKAEHEIEPVGRDDAAAVTALRLGYWGSPGKVPASCSGSIDERVARTVVRPL